MNRYQIIALIIMAIFYSIYLTKMLFQKKKGIETDQMAKGKSDRKRFIIELIMKIATICVVIAELLSILYGHSMLKYNGKVIGIVLGIIGVIIFFLAVITMGDSWRAGIAENEQTSFVQNGIYKISRNPAFLGFDLVYIGILLMFFNWFLLLFTLWAIIMLHLQILEEEKYLPTVFGDEYRAYKQKVCRYFGRKTWKFFVPCGILIIGACAWYLFLPNLSFEEMLQSTTKTPTLYSVEIIKMAKFL